MQGHQTALERGPQAGLVRGAGGRQAQDHAEALGEVHHGDGGR